MNQHALPVPPCPPAQVLTAAVELYGPLQLDHLGDIAFALSLCAMSMDERRLACPRFCGCGEGLLTSAYWTSAAFRLVT